MKLHHFFLCAKKEVASLFLCSLPHSKVFARAKQRQQKMFSFFVVLAEKKWGHQNFIILLIFWLIFSNLSNFHNFLNPVALARPAALAWQAFQGRSPWNAGSTLPVLRPHGCQWLLGPRGTRMTSISGAEPLKCGTYNLKGPQTSWIPGQLGPRTSWIPGQLGPRTSWTPWHVDPRTSFMTSNSGGEAPGNCGCWRQWPKVTGSYIKRINYPFFRVLPWAFS